MGFWMVFGWFWLDFPLEEEGGQLEMVGALKIA